MSKSGKMTRLVMAITPPTPMLGPIISIRVMTPAKMAIKLSFAMLMTFAPSSGGVLLETTVRTVSLKEGIWEVMAL